MNKQNRNRIIDTENVLIVARWEGVWGMGEKVERIKKYNWWLQNSNGDINYSMGNIINISLITMYGVIWV